METSCEVIIGTFLISLFWFSTSCLSVDLINKGIFSVYVLKRKYRIAIRIVAIIISPLIFILFMFSIIFAKIYEVIGDFMKQLLE